MFHCKASKIYAVLVIFHFWNNHWHHRAIPGWNVAVMISAHGLHQSQSQRQKTMILFLAPFITIWRRVLLLLPHITESWFIERLKIKSNKGFSIHLGFFPPPYYSSFLNGRTITQIKYFSFHPRLLLFPKSSMLCLVEAASCCSIASWCLLVPAAFFTDSLILRWYCCLLLRCTVNGDGSLYISNMMHPFRFYISLSPRCCYYQSWHHSFNMMAPVFPFICYGQETGKHFIFQAQQNIFFKKWLFFFSISFFLV